MGKDAVRTYYGETLGGTQDLKTSACCPASAPPPGLANIHPDVSARTSSLKLPGPVPNGMRSVLGIRISRPR